MYYSPTHRGFYDSPVFEDCVVVSDELHNEIYEIVRAGGTIVNDEHGMPVAIPAEQPVVTIDDVFQGHLAACNRDYERAVGIIRATYPFSESVTWSTQIREARLYDKWRQEGREGDKPDTPFLDDLNVHRTARGVGSGFDDLVDRILANNAVYGPAITELTAERHRAEKAMIEALGNADEQALQAVSWDYNTVLQQIG